jgi:quinol monooxygenase YgiN
MANHMEGDPMSKVLTVVAKVRAAPGKGDALAALLVEQVATVRSTEPGCVAYTAHRSTSDPDLFIFYEQYEDDAAFDVHRRSPHLAAYRERREAEGLIARPAEVETFRPIAG